MLGTGLCDSVEELENTVDVEPVGDIIEETEGCRVCVLNDVDDTEVVELMLGPGLDDTWADHDDVVEGECEAEIVGVVVLDTTTVVVPVVD